MAVKRVCIVNVVWLCHCAGKDLRLSRRTRLPLSASSRRWTTFET